MIDGVMDDKQKRLMDPIYRIILTSFSAVLRLSLSDVTSLALSLLSLTSRLGLGMWLGVLARLLGLCGASSRFYPLE